MNWYVTAFSKLTNVSVRTLHHYDGIGLLKPSLRSDSNYRLYSESDLLKLQTIVALKFFGFSLEQIKVLVKQKADEMYGDLHELKDAMWLAYKHNKIPNAPFDQQLWDFIDKVQRAGKK